MVWWAAALAMCVVPAPTLIALGAVVEMVLAVSGGRPLEVLIHPLIRCAPLILHVSAGLVIGALVGLLEPRRGPPGSSIIVGGLAGVLLGALVAASSLALMGLHRAPPGELIEAMGRILRQDGPLLGGYGASFVVLGALAGVLRPPAEASLERRVGGVVMLLPASAVVLGVLAVALFLVVALPH